MRSILLGFAVLNLAATAPLEARDDRLSSFEEAYSEPAKARRAELVRLKELLRGMAPENRSEFGASLRLVNGKVASAHLAPLRRSMKGAQVDQVVDRLMGSPEAEESPKEPDAGTKRTDLVVLSKLTEGLSPEAKLRFYDSLVFKDGELVSFFAGDLRQNRSDTEFQALLRSLGGTDEAPKGLCGNGWCRYADGVCKAATCR